MEGERSVGERGRTCSYNSYLGLNSHSIYHNFDHRRKGKRKGKTGRERRKEEERYVCVREERREGEFWAFRSTMMDYM